MKTFVSALFLSFSLHAATIGDSPLSWSPTDPLGEGVLSPLAFEGILDGLEPLVAGAGGGSNAAPASGVVFDDAPSSSLAAPVSVLEPRGAFSGPSFDLIYPPDATLIWPPVPDYFIIRQIRGEVSVVGNPVSYGERDHILTDDDIRGRLVSLEEILRGFKQVQTRLLAKWKASLAELTAKGPSDLLIRDLEKTTLEFGMNGVWDVSYKDNLGSLHPSIQERLKHIQQAASDFSLYPEDVGSIEALFKKIYSRRIGELYYDKYIFSINSRVNGLKRVETLYQRILQMGDLKAKVLMNPYSPGDGFLGVVEYIPIGVLDCMRGVPSDIIGISKIVLSEHVQRVKDFDSVHGEKRPRVVQASCGE